MESYPTTGEEVKRTNELLIEYNDLFQKYTVWREAYKKFYGEYPSNVWILSDEEERKIFGEIF